jgi:hypothetical protein
VFDGLWEGSQNVAKKKRQGISTRTRFEIFKRDRFTCQYCGQTPPTVVLEIDHIIAVASGGGNEVGNLLTACKECNAGKSDRPLTAAPASLASNIAEQRERAEQVKQYTAFLLEQREAELATVRRLGWYWFNKLYPENEQDKWGFLDAEEQSIRTFLKRLTEVEIMNAMDIAHGRKPARRDYWQHTWKYFCGVCWSMIRGAGK